MYFNNLEKMFFAYFSCLVTRTIGGEHFSPIFHCRIADEAVDGVYSVPALSKYWSAFYGELVITTFALLRRRD